MTRLRTAAISFHVQQIQLPACSVCGFPTYQYYCFPDGKTICRYCVDANEDMLYSQDGGVRFPK